MQSAAGGTSQRLKPAFAIVCWRSKIPAPVPDTVPALLIVVIHSSPAAALAGHVCRPRSLLPYTLNSRRCANSRLAAPHNSRDAGATPPPGSYQDDELGQKPALVS